MKRLALVATMLRYRVASLLLPFFLLAPAMHGRLQSFTWSLLAGVVALAASYVVATCLNDIFDLEIDRINHPQAADRPLVSGAASVRQMVAVAASAAVVALAAAIALGPAAAILVATSLLLNVAYSIPPVRLCARAVPAPLVLAFAYVALPYGIGLAASHLTPESVDLRLVGCFMVLFAGRMLLKDFRDRRGDATYGKRTFLLTYGKRTTLIAVGICIAAGDLMLIAVLPSNLLLIAVIETYFVAIGYQLYRLWSAIDLDDERTAIALGARMGNAVILTLLGFVVLRGSSADAAELITFVLLLAAVFWSAFVYATTRPSQAVAAYRG